jgi:hypothetical protein
LPNGHALRKGATYRLLGSTNSPELLFERQYSWSDWDNEPSLERLEIAGASPLYQVLCAEDSGGQCTYPGKVVLEENLDYTIHQEEAEFVAESLRTIRVKAGADAIYYEYVRQPCVELSFFKNGVKVESHTDRVRDTSPRIYTAETSMCADPRRDVATGEFKFGLGTLLAILSDRLDIMMSISRMPMFFDRILLRPGLCRRWR